MKNKRSLKFQITLLAFTVLFLSLLACTVSLNKEITQERKQSDNQELKDQNGLIFDSKIQTITYPKTDVEQFAIGAENPRVKICKKYAACGCQSYESCMRDLKNDPTPDEPGILECILASSCKSLCAGKPDCGGSRSGRSQPKRSNCSQVRCSRDSDCPGDCHGGCSEGRCYSF